MTGRILSHYRIAEEISRGGMGVVYRATDIRLNRDVAIKVLPKELTGDTERKRRFVLEAQAASSLEHPNIAVIHEVDEAEGLSFIAMELIRGESLREILMREPLAASRALELTTDVASGMARAHERGFVHRDLKPSNVMVTEEGHAKIIDFGLAKLLEPWPDDTRMPTVSRDDTADGVVLGTAAYMSPEQARGARVDHRSDIFSLGVLLHELLAGQPPFQGRNTLEIASAILTEPAPRLTSLGANVTPDLVTEVQHVLDKCLAKDPADRYQGMKDVVVDLRACRRRLESAAHPPSAGRQPRRMTAWAWPAGALVATAALVLITRAGPPQSAAVATDRTAADRPSVAVLYFDNSTGAPELDWLRTGITEMVVTDLSQSQDLEVVGTDRLYEVMRQLNSVDDRVTSPGVIRAVAERTGVSSVVVGSYQKAGDAIRINVRLQDARSGRILSSERVDGPNEATLFSMVDDLSRRILLKIQTVHAGSGAVLLRGPGQRGGTVLDRAVGDVTTTSIDAYRLYAEGINLHDRLREADAARLFDRAVAVDPAFAMAYAKLAVVHNNLGHFTERDKYAQLALKFADRLTLRERYYIEGFYYSTRPDGSERSMDAYRKCVALDPGHEACRTNLANGYFSRDRYDAAIAEYEALLQRGATIPQVTGNLTLAYRALGMFEKARVAVDRFQALNPDSAVGYVYAGDTHIASGEHEQAGAAYAKAASIDPALQSAAIGRLVAAILQENWRAADDGIRVLSTARDPSGRWFGAMFGATVQLFHGRSRDALSWLDVAATTFDRPGIRSAQSHLLAAQILAARGEPVPALSRAQSAVLDSRGLTPQINPLGAVAEIQAELGQRAEAEATLARVLGAGRPDEYRVDRAFRRGLVEWKLGNVQTAADALTEARAVLSPRGAYVQTPNMHVPIWYAQGHVSLATGHPGEAERWFERATSSGYERMAAPLEYVRSFYFLGRLCEQRGDGDKAREAYRRFVGYWKDGDIDRGRVAEASAKLR